MKFNKDISQKLIYQQRLLNDACKIKNWLTQPINKIIHDEILNNRNISANDMKKFLEIEHNIIYHVDTIGKKIRFAKSIFQVILF